MKKVLLITALFFGLPVLVFSVGPELELSVGFADRFRSGTVTAVSVYVRNPDAALDADLVLDFTSGTALREGDRHSFRRSLHLSAGNAGVFRFSLPLEVSSYPLTARLEQRGLLIAEVKKELRPLNVDRPLIVGLSRRPSLDPLLPVLGSHFQRPIELVYPRSEFLPVSPEAWEGVSLAIWHDLSPEIPDPGSLEALGLWIEGGGELIVVSGPWLAGRRFPDSLLPGTIQPPLIIDGFPVYLPGFIAPDSEAVETADEVIVLPRGLGRILYVTRDMLTGALAEEERQLFWTDLIGGFTPQDRREAEERREIEKIEKIIHAAWLHDEQAMSAPLGGPLLLVGLFSLAVACLLLAGRRIHTSRQRVLQLGIILLLSAGVSAAAVLEYFPPGKELSLTPRILKLLITDNFGSTRLSSRIRFTSPGGETADWPLPDRGFTYLRGGGDLTIIHSPSGPLVEELKLEPWTPVELVHEIILPGYRHGDRAEQERPGGLRHNGQTTWYEVVLIDSGQASLLAPEWNPGEILTLPEGTPRNIIDIPDPPPNGYYRIIEALAAASPETGQIVLARDEKGIVILHTGGGL